MRKRFFLLLVCFWIACINAMEEKEKGLVLASPESSLESLLDSFDQVTLDEQDEQLLKTFGYNDKEITVEHYPEIGFEIAKSDRLSLAEKWQILSKLSWGPGVDNDTKQILNFFESYCFAEKYHRALDDEGGYNDNKEVLTLSWRALLDIESDAPCNFLLKRGSLIIPRKIVHQLIEMGDIHLHHKFIKSPEQGKQVVRRLHFVLQNGASVTVPFSKSPSERSFSDTPVGYVAWMVSHLKRLKKEFNTAEYLNLFNLHPQRLDLHLLYYKNILTLFVRHLKKSEEGNFLIEKYGDLPVDQIVEKCIEDRMSL
jgi:hypothetical protein